MNIRDTLIYQCPSLAAFREAQAEIARLDAGIAEREKTIRLLEAELAATRGQARRAPTDAELDKLAIEYGFGTECEGPAYPRGVLWFDADPLPLMRAVITTLDAA